MGSQISKLILVLSSVYKTKFSCLEEEPATNSLNKSFHFPLASNQPFPSLDTLNGVKLMWNNFVVFCVFESQEHCLQRCRLYCISIPVFNAEMKPVLPLPVETEHLVVMTLQFLDCNLSVELLVPTSGNIVRDCFAAKSIKMLIAVYSL